MRKLVDRFFAEDETLGPRTLISAGLLAYATLFLAPLFGGTLYIVLLGLMILSAALLCYAALRELMPMMDPRDPDADRFVVWGAFVIFLGIGAASFGLLFLPAFFLGAALLYWRASELFEIIPGMDRPGNSRGL